MARQSSIENNSRIGSKSTDFGVGWGGNGSGSIRGGLGGNFGPTGDGGIGQGGSGDGGGKSGSSSLGFIAAYGLVLGLTGYVLMTDDSATAGAFSLFTQSEEEDDSFRVRSVRVKDRGAMFDWSRSSSGKLERWGKSNVNVGELFASGGKANVFGKSGGYGGGGFLLPGQLDQILDAAPSSNSYSSFSGKSAGSHNRPDRLASAQIPNRTSVRAEKQSAAEYQLYSFDTPKPAGVVPVNELNSVQKAGDAAHLGQIQVFKGRVAKVSGVDGFDWKLDLRLRQAARAKPSRLKLSGAQNPDKLGKLVGLAWSSQPSTYLYQLEPGNHGQLSLRGRELVGTLDMEAGSGKGRKFSLKTLRAALETASKRKNYVYVVRRIDSSTNREDLRSILIQDLRARTWQVFGLGTSDEAAHLVKARFDTAG